MELLELRRQFERTVAPLEIGGPRPAGPRTVFQLPGQFALDVARVGRDEAFVLWLGEGADRAWRFQVTSADPTRRHLLLVAARADTAPLLVRNPRTRAERAAVADTVPRRFLCGHDERHLFIAGLTARVTTVAAALAALKPAAVLQSEAEHRVGARARNRRRNEGFVRQGEWFFLPRPRFVPGTGALVLRDEPISRGKGKPHRVDFLCREAGGESVWVCGRHPLGVTDRAYEGLLHRDPSARKWNWRRMVRTTLVYARGRVRHPDHATIVLPFWHQVVPNSEAGAGSATRQSVAFLD